MNNRYDFIDLSRGFIIACMALDHVRFFISKAHGGESWGVAMPDYDGDTAAFLARWITHLCAPGFFFLMGVSMALATEAKTANGISLPKIRNHFLIRGAILILLQISLINVAWLVGSLSAEVEVNGFGSGPVPGESGDFWIYFGVLSSLGSAMIVLCSFLSLPNIALAGIALGIIVISFILFPTQAPAESHFAMWERLLWIPGQTDILQVRYPIIPWVGVAMLGLIYGRQLKTNTNTPIHGAVIGIFLLLVMFAMRGAFNWGDHHQLSDDYTWIDFLNVTKYPPSLSFLCVTLGINLILLLGFNFFRNSQPSEGSTENKVNIIGNFLLAPLRTFGSATLAFYLLHLYLYGAMGYLFPTGASLSLSLLAWLVGLGVLFPTCVYWRKFKSSRPANSWAHYF